MNVVKEINRINQKELELGLNGASWHDEYKDSAYIFAGGIHTDLTEGDVITIFSQYGEIMDINMPRDKETGKPKGFAFLMYEDQRSTVLSVDNLNGAIVLGRTLRVDHVKDYKQPRLKNDDGEWAEPEEQSMNAKPEIIEGSEPESDSSASTGASIDPEDPMRDYLIAQRREAKAKKLKRKDKHKDETPEQRRARKAKKKEKKEKRLKSAGMKGVEELLESLTKRGEIERTIPRVTVKEVTLVIEMLTKVTNKKFATATKMEDETIETTDLDDTKTSDTLHTLFDGSNLACETARGLNNNIGPQPADAPLRYSPERTILRGLWIDRQPFTREASKVTLYCCLIFFYLSFVPSISLSETIVARGGLHSTIRSCRHRPCQTLPIKL